MRHCMALVMALVLGQPAAALDLDLPMTGITPILVTAAHPLYQSLKTEGGCPHLKFQQGADRTNG